MWVCKAGPTQELHVQQWYFWYSSESSKVDARQHL